MKNLWRNVHLRTVLYMAILVFSIGYIAFHAETRYRPGTGGESRVRDFGAYWQLEDGSDLENIRRIPSPKDGSSVVLRKKLPDDIQDGECLNFDSHNVYFTLRIGSGEDYSFYLQKNLTGNGYGDAFHNIFLQKSMAGEVVEIHAQCSFPGEKSSGFEKMEICDHHTFYRSLIEENGIQAILSGVVIFFGIAAFMVRYGIVGRRIEYNLNALGVTVILLGGWTLLETRILQMLTGYIVFFRELDYLLLLFAGYPMVLFINSLTKKNRLIYNHIAFGLSVLVLLLIFGLRFLAGIDMHYLNVIAHISFVADGGMIIHMLYKNYRYCQKKGIEDNLKFFYIGAVAFAAGGVLDMVVYNLYKKSGIKPGVFLRIGLLFFIIMMFQQIMNWISAEQRLNKRNQFINNLLTYSMSGDSPDEIIYQMLEYLGNEMRAERCYIFEDRWDGTHDNTCEWCRDGVESKREGQQKVPFEGMIAGMYQEFEHSKCVVINDIEAYHNFSGAAIYHYLKDRNVETMVAGPLEIRGKYIGFLCMDNPPVELTGEISESIRLLAYFITVVLRQRDEQQELINYSYFDQMTGTKNRRAQQEYIDHGLDRGAAYGFVMCDINGLKTVNDNQGHEEGDRMICDVAEVLIMVFGKDNVYRLGGDEFSAFGTWKTRGDFFYAIENVRDLLRAKGRSASLGYVYRPEGDEEFDRVKVEADELMYADKAAYYAAHPELNRRA